MIYLLSGENTYAREQELAKILGSHTPEKIDGENLEMRDVPDLFAGQTLFADARTIVIRGLAENAAVWNELEKYLDKLADTTTLILVETKPDKRSKTYKLLQQSADCREFPLPRNSAEAERFTLEEAKTRQLKIDQKLVRQLVGRVGLEPWDIVHALEKLSVLDTIDAGTIETVIETSPSEQVFGLFEASLRGDSARLRQMCETLALSEDPYRVMGLLATQLAQLAALVTADSGAAVAQDLGLKSDYGLSKLRPYARTMTRARLRNVVDALADADAQMKSTGEDPWALIEQALQKIATL